MENTVSTYRSKLFIKQLETLTFKENNFVFKQCRTLVEMFKSNLNTEHLEEINTPTKDEHYFLLKIKKDRRVILTVQQNSINNHFEIAFLMLTEIENVENTLAEQKDIDLEPLNFKEFW